MVDKKKETIVIKWFSLMAIIFACFVFTACAHFKGKETVDQDPIKKTENIPDKVPGVDLVRITTQSGYIVEVPRSSIPTNKDGVAYWDVVRVEENTTLKGSAEASSLVPGVGTLIGGGIAALLAFTTNNQRKQKQAALDAKRTGEEDIKLREKLMIAASVGVELGTTDGTIKKKIKGLMTKREQALFDDITESARVAAKAAKEIVSS